MIVVMSMVPPPPPPDILESLGALLRAANPLARRNDVSGSLMKPTAVTLANANAPFTTGAIAERGSAGLGDVAKDLGMYAVGGAVGKGVQAGSQLAGRVAKLPADTRQLYLNSLMGRLYHGSKDGGLPATLGNRGPQPKNWFQADTFLTTSRPLAGTYAGDANSLYRARVPLDVAEDMNVMDLYRDPDRLMEIANSPRISEILGGTGANVVRHQSGHGVGMGGLSTPIRKPVYAFTEPAGIRMSQVRNSGNLERFSNFLDSQKRGLQIGLDRLLKRGAFDPANEL